MIKTDASFNVLYTEDVARTAAFFQTLGITPKQQANDKVVVTIGSFELHYILGSSEPFEEYRYITDPRHYGQGVIFYVETANIQEIARKIPAAGGVVKSSIFNNKWGCRELLTEDPNGYKFAFYQA